MNIRSVTVMVIMTVMLLPLYAITVEEIISKRDDNEYIETAKVEMKMLIVNGNREIENKMISYMDDNNVLIEFTNTRDRGTKFLKRNDNLWMFFPEAEDLVKISGHMLKQGMMGSDFSYQDMMESDKLTDLYDFELIGEEDINGRMCYVIEGIAVEGKEVSYYRRKSWVDKERFIGIKEELYAKSGRLLKEMNVIEVKQIEGRWFPVKTIMKDKLRQNTRTEVTIDDIVFNIQLDDNIFTLENLQ